MPTNDAAAERLHEQIQQRWDRIAGFAVCESSPDHYRITIDYKTLEKAQDAYRAMGEITELLRLAALRQPAAQGVQCCKRDHNGDGNCDIHSAPGVLRHSPTPPAPPTAEADQPARDLYAKLRARITDFEANDEHGEKMLGTSAQFLANCLWKIIEAAPAADADLRAEVERLRRELDAAVAHHSHWTGKLIAALPEYERFSGDLMHNVLCAIESLRGQLAQAEAAAGAMRKALLELRQYHADQEEAAGAVCFKAEHADCIKDIDAALANAAAANTNSPRGQE